MRPLNPRRITVDDYTPEWASKFMKEKELLLGAVGSFPCISDIQHIGSTSVPGLAAKPIIDIAIGTTSFEEAVVCIEPISALGYRYRGEAGIPRRHLFVKENPDTVDSAYLRTHHVHILEVANDEWTRHLIFRDALRSNPDLVEQYTALKRELARRFIDNTIAYTEGKTDFIMGVVNRQRS